ncbi:Uma2 family endonuclease [Polyangium sp. 6x1]|uniref:Uma2 family endonuclease n=1 Tax=Polyangium sp. 6x1 TaxID=3042689 RepID=UPI0024823E5F|nr:Uma2 family endonuclease [Polyangium sp. 6x1]MDI1450091.1 Uma2 family endonuclease [Polyangium sp. 6x1]
MMAFAMADVLQPEPITLEQWADMDEDEPGELVDGALVEEEVPTNLHELIVSWLFYALMTWAKERGARVFGSDHKLAVAARRGRKPDVTVYAARAKVNWQASLSRVPPLMVVEVISQRARDVRRDRVEKLRDYARFGIRWYCLVAPDVQLLEILELGADGRYTIALQASNERVVVPGCEGLELDLADLWRTVDEANAEGGEEDDEPCVESREG